MLCTSPSTFIIVISFIFQLVHQTYSATSLWCHQGGGRKQYKPIRCDVNTTECYKFVCLNGQWPFIARGCGLPVLTMRTDDNRSCSQAMIQCDYLDGIGLCITCSNEHMCNGISSYYHFHVFPFVLYAVFEVFS